jgi:hypothetical protein
VNDTRAGLRWRGDYRYREIRYEELISAPETVLRRLLIWLDEPWNPEILRFHETHEERSSDASNPGIKLPVYKRALNRWRTDLPHDAVEWFDAEAHQLLIELGYVDDETWTGELQTCQSTTSSQQ